MLSKTTEVTLLNFRFDVDSVSQRALTKPVYQTISLSGKSGSDGHPGAGGYSGSDGSKGSRGCSGGNGGSGKKGSAGQSGQSGQDSEHAWIALSGTVDNLNTQLTTFKISQGSLEHSAGINWTLAKPLTNVNHNFQLAKSSGIILVKAVGGNGGRGGVGGNGGNGGNGARGGRGFDGSDGRNAHHQNDTAGKGSDGASGGKGGRGGDGGKGGSGGNGGSAGAGGHIQVRSVDPRLFMLIELDCRAGIKGKGSHGGTGGSYGVGGVGGPGGTGGRGGSGWPPGDNGSNGSYGKDGKDGSRGNIGSHGQDGWAARNGSIQYAVVAIDGSIIEVGFDKYHASVIGYTITDENNDGIYEPNSDFFITNVKWTNNGAMIMPDGAILSFPSTGYITNDANDISVLPGICINQVLIDPHRFKCHINAASVLPMNKPYIQPMKMTSQINLLNRLFSGSEVSTSLSCQYPIHITSIEIPTFLGPNERAIVSVHFANISARSYGACSDSAGSIEFIFSVHSLLKILPANKEYFYEIMSDGRGRYKINENIPPRSTKCIRFEIALGANAANQYYEHLFWNINLLLRDVLIENHRNNIRVVPTFRPNIHTDVLLVTNVHVGRSEFLAYQNLFRLFKYSSQTWDIERYGAFHNPELTWLNTTELIIFIYSKPESTFQTMKSHLFLQHMMSSENAGFICIGAGLPMELDFGLFDYNNLQFINIEQKTKLVATNHLWHGFGFTRPTDSQLNVKANKFRKNYEKQDDHKFLYQVVYDDTANEDSAGCMTVSYGAKYVYKSALDSQVDNRISMVPCDNPLLTSSNLPFVLQTQMNTNQHEVSTNKIDNNSQVRSIITNEIDLNSQFGRLLCAILFYQGFEKSHMIISEQSELAFCIFTTGSNKLNFSQILVSLAMSIIEREYDRESLQFESSKQLVDQITNIIGKENNTDNEFGVDTNGWFYLLIQALYGYIESKFWSSFPWCGCTNKAKQRHKLQEILNDLLSLTTNGIPKNKEIQRQVQILRLQKLANLNFPTTDKREICARPMNEVRAWQLEQNIEAKPSELSDELGKF
ncbi:unnamed protein product [Adineta steineri]|uniref:DUF7932 domain-containing protein n=3 Tax=Adineta steineri TaxID=433720 RepID=A0A819I8U7_9BILA|nr:unnamed protein product [Adineta steineri]CAF3909170.1 unnamed protein product [Adineta steineri]